MTATSDDWRALADLPGYRRMRRVRNWNDPKDFWVNRHCIYRMYDAAGRLLYVGVSSDLPTRMYDHKRVKPWYPEVARFVIKLAPTRRAALDAEREAIRSERPLYNRQSNLASA